jgi:glucose 1-dehydrogenase
MKLDGKIALITGAGKGIGAAIAVGFAAEGATVLVNDIPEATYTDEVVQSIRRDGRQAEAVYADLSQVSEIRRIFAAISEKYGRLDILVNNAGITGWSDFYETEEAIFDRVVQLNLKGTLFCTIEAAKIMRETGGGSIIIFHPW